MNRFFSLVILLVCFAPISAQVRYWVQFKDKNNTPFSVANPKAFLTQKSLDRRAKQSISIDQTDLPVNPQYITILNTVYGIKVLYVSKWLNGALVRIDSLQRLTAITNSISALPFVSSAKSARKFKVSYAPVETLVEIKETNPSGRSSGVKASEYGASKAQVYQVGVNCMHEQGYKGDGMTIGVMDVGFNNVNTGSVFNALRSRNGILGMRDFVDGDEDVYSGGDHGTYVLSCIAGFREGQAMGTAPMAKFWLFRTEQGASETISEEYNWVRAAEYADSVGCDILTTSLGYTTFDNGNDHKYAELDGRTAPMSIAANMAARKGLFVLNAAGNEGGSPWKYIAVAGDADSICTVGAVDTLGVYADFSSVGPTADGRIKPDLVATGWNTVICNDNNCFYGSGTSFATPLMAGVAACLWQYRPGLTNMQLLSALKSSANQSNNPNNKLGWGVPNLCKLMSASADFELTAFELINNQLSIELTYNLYQFIHYKIIDLEGKIVANGTLDASKLQHKIYTGNLTSNMYVLKIETSIGNKNLKFVKH